MKELLLDMLNRLPGALGAAVVGPDGLAVASSTIRPGVNMEVASAETIHVVKRTGWTPDGEAQEPPDEIALASRTRLTVLRALGSGYFLCLVTGPETIPGQARYEAARRAEAARGARVILDDEIKDLMRYIENSSFVEFEIEREGFKLKLVRRLPGESNGQPQAPAVAQPAEPVRPVVQEASPAPVPTVVEAPPADVHTVKSPIVGTFYRATAPEAKPFASPGDRVSKGQVLCIVEAMKLMNEIESDCDGEVLAVLVANGQPVEYGEPLFTIRTAAVRSV